MSTLFSGAPSLAQNLDGLQMLPKQWPVANARSGKIDRLFCFGGINLCPLLNQGVVSTYEYRIYTQELL